MLGYNWNSRKYNICTWRKKIYYESEERYILAQEDTFCYTDVFTKTRYSKWDRIRLHVGDECVKKSRRIITTEGFITKEVAFNMLQELNPTYLPGKPLVRKK